MSKTKNPPIEQHSELEGHVAEIARTFAGVLYSGPDFDAGDWVQGVGHAIDTVYVYTKKKLSKKKERKVRAAFDKLAMVVLFPTPLKLHIEHVGQVRPARAVDLQARTAESKQPPKTLRDSPELSAWYLQQTPLMRQRLTLEVLRRCGLGLAEGGKREDNPPIEEIELEVIRQSCEGERLTVRDSKTMFQTYYGALFPDEVQSGQLPEFGPPYHPVCIRYGNGDARIVLGSHDFEGPGGRHSPDVQIERQPNCWALYVNSQPGWDTSAVVYMMDDGSTVVQRQIPYSGILPVRFLRDDELPPPAIEASEKPRDTDAERPVVATGVCPDVSKIGRPRRRT